MATKTLAQIRSIVRFRGDFRNTVRLPDSAIDVEIQAAFGEGYELVADVNEGYFDTTATLSTVASQGFVALPSNAWRVRALDRLDGEDFCALEQVGIKDRNRYGSSRDKPLAYRLTARGADLYPTPDAIYSLRLTHTPTAPTLGATPTEFYNGWEEYTVYGTLVRLALHDERDPGDWLRQLEMQRMRIKGAASQRQAAGPEYLVLHDLDEGYDPDGRWW